MLKTKMILRYVMFLAGLFIIGLGIALSTKMGLGTTPISVIPLVLSGGFPISFGMVANILNLIFVMIQILIQREGFNRDILMQILIVPFFGYFIDFGFAVFGNLEPGSIIIQLSLLVVGCLLMALGIYMQIVADVIINPCEGLVKAISERFKTKFGNVKIMMDVSIMLVGVTLSLIVFGEVRGVGIATVVVAVSTGFFIKVFKKIFDNFSPNWLFE